MKILIRTPNPLGDAIMAIPAIEAIRAFFKDSKIILFTKENLKSIYEGLNLYDEIILYKVKKPKLFFDILYYPTLLRKKNIDLAIIFPNSFSSAMIAFLSGIRRRVGYVKHKREFLLTDRIFPESEPMYMVDYYLILATYLGCPIVSKKPKLFVSKDTLEKIEGIFDKLKINKKAKRIVIIPGAEYGSSKCWKVEYFAKLCDMLKGKYEVEIFLAPSPKEKKIAQEILSLTKSEVHSLILSLEELKALIYKADLLISNDTGPRHIGVCFNIPSVILMGPTDPRYTNGNLRKTIILRKDLPCSPCHKKVCPKKDHPCMSSIKPEEVFSACEKLLKDVRNY